MISRADSLDAARGRRDRVAIYLPDLAGGGAERLLLKLAPAWRDLGLDPLFLLDRAGGALMDAVPEGIAVHLLGASRQLAAFPRLVRWLRRERPAALIANMEHMNVMAVAARAVARVPTRIVAVQHSTLSDQIRRPSAKWRAIPALYRLALPHADAVVAVSHGVADDMARLAGLRRDGIDVIHNGLVDADFERRAASEPDDPWFADAVPVVVGMGRFVPEKDFSTLLRGFATLPPASAARLILLGDGPERAALEALARNLGIAERVAMPGFVDNPLPWLRRARLFALSSRAEGFGNVLVEALACGTPVVGTDCPFGPREILDGGRFGRLVPVGDGAALGAAIADALAEAHDPAALAAHGRSFTVASCAAAYARLMVAP